MRQPKFKQLVVLGFELVLLALIVKGVARALLKDEHRDAGGDQFRQLIVSAPAAIFNLSHVLKQLREEMLDGLI
jgi:hypothetical protein